jgi:(2Fe-2S) ferredoxin
MTVYKKHIFICVNHRDSNPQTSCAPKGGLEVQKLLKQKLKDRGLDHEVRANKAGCLDACKQGVSMVIYPDQIWYGQVTIDDIDEIIEESVVGDRIIERLQTGFTKKCL